MKRRSDKIANIKEDIFDFTKAIQKKNFSLCGNWSIYYFMCYNKLAWPGSLSAATMQRKVTDVIQRKLVLILYELKIFLDQ